VDVSQDGLDYHKNTVLLEKILANNEKQYSGQPVSPVVYLGTP